MKHTITKDEVLEALRTENLAPEYFFHSVNDMETNKDLKTCKVCAVGAILRKMSFTKKYPDSVTTLPIALTGGNYALQSLASAYDSGNFLGILSTEFEYAGNELSTHESHGYGYGEILKFTPKNNNILRMHALMIAEGFCPEILEVEV